MVNSFPSVGRGKDFSHLQIHKQEPQVSVLQLQPWVKHKYRHWHICIQEKTNKNKLQVNNPESAQLDKKKAVSYYLLPIHSGDLSWFHPTEFLKQRNVDRSLQAQVSTSPLEASTDFPAQAMVPQTLTQASVKELLAETACLGQAQW